MKQLKGLPTVGKSAAVDATKKEIEIYRVWQSERES